MTSLSRLAVLALLSFSVACSFDGSALDDRPPCDTDDDCPNGSCIAGSCWNPATIDDDTGAADGGDVGDDVGDDIADTGRVCEPGEGRCVGSIAGICNEAGDGWHTADCDDEAVCPTGDCTCSAGVCEPAGCEAGERRCEGNVALVCNDLGDAWDEVSTCGEDEVCLNGSCIETTCEPGETACADGLLIRCSETGAPIVLAECAESDAWCSDVPDVHCEPWVCSPASVRCNEDADGTEVCAALGNAWEEADACEIGETCEDGECVELACLPGAQRCSGPLRYATCGETGESEIITACPGGEYCSESGEGTITCLPQTCTPGDRRCAEGVERAEICDERGSGYTIAIDCSADQYCREGICTEQVCEPSTSYCVGPFAYLTCNARGSSESMTTCDDGFRCDDDAGSASCVPQVCTPGDRQCASATLVDICDEAGAGYDDHEICTEGNACDSGSCAPVICAPSAFECTGGTTYRLCNPVGTAWVASACDVGTYCSDEDTTCLDQVCEPDARACDGDDLIQCNAIGSGTTVLETCPFGCADGACNPSVCGDGIVWADDGETCDDENDDPCDGCDACNLARAAVVNAATTTTTAPVWQPDESDFTIEAWVNVTSNAGSLFGLGRRDGTDFARVAVSDGKLVFEYGLGAGVVVNATSGATVSGTGWHHVAVERFARWGAAIFIDGQLEAFNHTPRSSRSIDAPTGVWVGSEGSTTAAAAQIDALRVSARRRYSLPFTPSRRFGADGSTVALYQFDEAAGGTVIDSSGNGRDMVLGSVTRAGDACYGASVDAIACGDGVAASWEECDDGNTANGDGCGANCLDEVCPAGEARGPADHCYFVNTSNRRWGQARDDCSGRGSGSNLVTINGALENDWLVYFLDLGGSYWIGLSDGSWENEGNYVWVRGDSGYRNWAPGEPNDGGTFSTEDCIEIYGSSAGDATAMWNDDDCGGSQGSICERY